MKTKRYIGKSVFIETQERIKYSFDNFEKLYISFSGGKDSTTMMHLVMDEAIKRNRKVGILIIDLEAQYLHTVEHIESILEMYKDNIEVFWVCLPIKLSNAVSNFEPYWICWDEDKRDQWVREFPKHKGVIKDIKYFDFFQKGMEFEEFIVLFGKWYSKGVNTGAFIGIRADESLNRFRTIATYKKEVFENKRWTTKIVDNLYNVYPIYDWKTQDIWIYHNKFPNKRYNKVYDLMHRAGVSLSQQRLCQPYGFDQRKGLWLYHMIEPENWYKVVNRVNGVNSGALYVQETGNITGYNKISKPKNHTWKSFCRLLLGTMPKITREHYLQRFKSFLLGWRKRGYLYDIPDEAPLVLENKQWVPSYRRMCKVLLRNDWWCKGLGQTQPKSEAYKKYLEIKKEAKNEATS